jgi:hypothetical protein
MDERLPDIRITVEPDPDTFAAEIETRLLDSLKQNVPASDYAPSEFSPRIVKARS